MIGRQALAWLAAGACTMLAVPAWAEGAPAPAGLVNPAQLAREHLARRIIARPELQASLRRTEAAYAADPAMRIPGAKANRDRAARAIALAAVYYAIGLALDPAQRSCSGAARRRKNWAGWESVDRVMALITLIMSTA